MAELTSKASPPDCTISTYHDIEMKGIDYLRDIYSASALNIKPKTKIRLKKNKLERIETKKKM